MKFKTLLEFDQEGIFSISLFPFSIIPTKKENLIELEGIDIIIMINNNNNNNTIEIEL